MTKASAMPTATTFYVLWATAMDRRTQSSSEEIVAVFDALPDAQRAGTEVESRLWPSEIKVSATIAPIELGRADWQEGFVTIEGSGR